MHPAFSSDSAGSAPLHVIKPAGYPAWAAQAPAPARAWLDALAFEPRAGMVAVLPGADGTLAGALLVASDPPSLWDLASAQAKLPARVWRLDDPAGLLPPDAALGWALAAYRFERYLNEENGGRPQLHVESGPALDRVARLAEAIGLARDLINTPTSDLGPAELAEAITGVGGRFGAEVAVTLGPDLLAANYPAIWTVGQASVSAPRLLDLRWGRRDAPRLTLVGKGVCFDTGGLDIKPAAGMLIMKKDMGGAAVLLALAQLVMASGLDVRLRLLVPAVENSIAGNAFRPGDVIRMRSGLTVEIGNTDAEGRLVLADALAEADQEHPDLLIDAATLTGACRVAIGPELPGLFTPDDGLATSLLRCGDLVEDPLWRLPLHAPYRAYLKSGVADINNAGSKPLAGAITAALFLKEFVRETRAWAHLDMFAWNDEARPGRPRGGEATALRALWALLEERYASA